MAKAVHYGTGDKPLCGILLGKHFSAEWEEVTCGLCLRRRSRSVQIRQMTGTG